MSFFSVSENLISHNTKIKEYPDGSYKMTVASKPVFKEKDFELVERFEKKPKPKDMNNATRDDSLRRAKDKVFDIAKLNDFSYFVTLTLDGQKIDRSDVKGIIEKLRPFLSNLVQRHNLSYLLIPEYHKENKAVHFHGLFSGDIKLVDSGTVKAQGHKKPIKIETAKLYGIPLQDCKTVYNLPQWTFGFSTAFKMDDNRNAISSYMTKYMIKDVQKIFGKFYLAGGKCLKRDAQCSYTDTDYFGFEGDNEVYCPVIDTSFKYFDSEKRGYADDIQGLV